MNKKLTARVQKLNPTIKEQEKNFSFGVVIEPDSKELSLSKGTIYAVFDISSDSVFDTNVASKVLHDVLMDTYYNTDSSSPIQSLEKALAKVKDNIYELQQNSSIVDSTIDFNAVISVLWGNVFYVVQYNKGNGYLMRANEVKPIQTSGEGNFSFASGIIKEDDVVILCTDSFTKKYPPNILLTKALSGKDLETEDSCLLLKFIVDTSFSEADLKDLSTITTPKKVGVESLLEKVADKFQTFNPTKEKSSMLVAAKPKVMNKPSIVFNKKNIFIAGCIIFTLLVAFGVYYLFSTNKIQSLNFKFGKAKETKPLTEETKKEDTSKNTVETEDFSKDAALKITRVTVKSTLFDLAIADKDINPSEFDIYSNKLLVSDSTTGKIYTSTLGNYKFLPLSESYLGIKYLVVSKEGDLTFGDNEGIKIYSITDASIKDTYSTKANNSLSVFGNFIYSFDGQKLIRYSKEKEQLVSTTWAETSDFSNVKGLQIAYSIYVATSDNNIVKYTTGKKDKFEISGLEMPFGNIVDFVVKEDFKNIYVADATNKRVVVLDIEGNFVKQYKYTDSEGWKDIKSIAINDKESTLYVLSGTKLYEITL